MRTSASFNVFPNQPEERDLARARWLAGQDRTDEALEAYRVVIAARPDERAAWSETFDLLRRAGRREAALEWARSAVARFQDAAFAHALEGAALIELQRYPDAMAALERAVDRDPDLALIWHELGYAAHQVGEATRALAALDRAFALEPHTATILLRGRILLEAGRYLAAEVAFEGAAQGAPHAEQRREAEEMIQVVRRHALFTARRPADLGPAQRFFARTGTVVLASASGAAPDRDLLEGVATLALDLGWQFGQLALMGPATPFEPLATALQLHPEPVTSLDPARIPLVAGRGPDEAAHHEWQHACAVIGERGAGLTFLLEHETEAPAQADLIGRLRGVGGAVDPATAVLQAQHPAARTASRRLVAPASRVASGG